MEAKGNTHCPLAIEQAVNGNHWGHGSEQTHNPSWKVHNKVAHKQKKNGVGQECHPCHCPPPYDPDHGVKYYSAVV